MYIYLKYRYRVKINERRNLLQGEGISEDDHKTHLLIIP